MALTDASRALEPPTAQAIGWDGQSLMQMLTEQERLFVETGRYYGLETLDLQRGDPIRYEKIFSRLRGGLVSARETAISQDDTPGPIGPGLHPIVSACQASRHSSVRSSRHLRPA